MTNTNVRQYKILFQPVLDKSQLAGADEITDGWFNPLSVSNAFNVKPSIIPAVRASGPMAPVLTTAQWPETPQVDKWFMALSEPNAYKYKPSLSPALVSTSTGPQAPVIQAQPNDFADGWWKPFSEPPQYNIRSSLSRAINATGPKAPVLAKDEDAGADEIVGAWWKPLGEPISYKRKPDLSGSVRASGVTFYPYPPTYTAEGYIFT